MIQKILFYVTPTIATTITVAVVSYHALRKKKVEISDEEYQIQWGNGAPDQYKDK